ncbi:MAG: hypothetical protein ACREIT_12325 [Tepidisphaeraceae bacterium]
MSLSQVFSSRISTTRRWDAAAPRRDAGVATTCASHAIVVSAPGHQTIRFELKGQWDGASLPQVALPGGSVLLATIKLDKVDGPASTQPVVMKEHKGKLHTESEYNEVKRREREDDYADAMR